MSGVEVDSAPDTVADEPADDVVESSSPIELDNSEPVAVANDDVSCAGDAEDSGVPVLPDDVVITSVADGVDA